MGLLQPEREGNQKAAASSRRSGPQLRLFCACAFHPSSRLIWAASLLPSPLKEEGLASRNQPPIPYPGLLPLQPWSPRWLLLGVGGKPRGWRPRKPPCLLCCWAAALRPPAQCPSQVWDSALVPRPDMSVLRSLHSLVLRWRKFLGLAHSHSSPREGQPCASRFSWGL